jgi:pimeloyl-ACP methyl ester carboxylesterase
MEGGEHSYSDWMDVPVWYLATTEDKALPVQAQRMFVQSAKDAGADVTLREVASSHSPMLSKPKETVDFILEAVAYFTR